MATGQDVVDRGWDLMSDTGVRWKTPECLRAINDGQREIVTLLPKSNAQRAVPLAVSGTRQTLAGLGLADGIEVLDVKANFNAAGTVRGRAISKRPRAWFDERRPGWHAETGIEAQHWFFDDRDPKAFDLYPGPLGQRIEVIYSAAPADLPNLGSTLSLDEIYSNAVMYYLLFRMNMLNKPGSMNPAGAQTWYSLMLQSLGLRDRTIVSNDARGTMKAAGK